MPSPKLNNHTYDGLKPHFKVIEHQKRFYAPKAFPCLPKPVTLSGDIDFPFTDEMIGMNALLDRSQFPTGKGLCAVVIDSGIYNHPFLEKAVIGHYSAVQNQNIVSDYYGHGTHMAGIIASRHHKSGMGIAKKADLISIKVTRGISGEATWGSIARALDITLELIESEIHKAQSLISVVNLSFNGLDYLVHDANRNSQKIMKLISKLYDLNIPVVVSAGNGYDELIKAKSGLGYPACSEMTINVGASINYDFTGLNEYSLATFSQRILSTFSDSASDDTVQKKFRDFILAPGACSVSLNNSADPNHKFSQASGTSSAAAIITGCILLYQEEYRNKNGNLPDIKTIKEAFFDASNIHINSREVPGATLPGAGPGTLVAPVVAPPSRNFDNKKYCGINIHKAINSI